MWITYVLRLDTLDKNQLCLQQPVSDDVFCAIVALLSATDVSDLVSYVPHRTVEQNIRYGKPDATRAEIEEAAKRANAFDFIMSFNDGFETQVGDKGSQLSGGQKQRIGELTMHLLWVVCFLLLLTCLIVFVSEYEACSSTRDLGAVAAMKFIKLLPF